MNTKDMLDSLPLDESIVSREKTGSEASHYLTKEEVYQSFAKGKLNEIVKTARREREAEAKKRREKIREMERNQKSTKEIEQLEDKRRTTMDVVKQSFADFSQMQLSKMKEGKQF